MFNFFTGVVIGVVFMASVVDDYLSETTDLTGLQQSGIKQIIIECESLLPRNQRCILVAQPEE